jgi:hypothetical protein
VYGRGSANAATSGWLSPTAISVASADQPAASRSRSLRVPGEEQCGEHQPGEEHQAIGGVAQDGIVQPAGVPGEVVDVSEQPVVETAQSDHVRRAPRRQVYYVRM